MQALKCDSKGRLFIKESLRHKYGQRFLVVPAPGKLLVIPVSEDPVAELHRLGKKIRHIPIKTIRAEARREAVRQAL